MARVEFTDDFDYRPSIAPRSLVAYKKGMTVTVRRECADQATAQGKAIELEQGCRPDEEVSEPHRRRARKPDT